MLEECINRSRIWNLDVMKWKMFKKNEALLIAPNKALLAEDKLVTNLPYESVDTVFNMQNVCKYELDTMPL